jgi:predicted transcriptional regulator
MNQQNITALRMERQYLIKKANEAEYIELYRDMQPGQNVYWNGFGDPPSLTYRADFDDIEYNRQRQKERQLIKGRFAGGNIGWITPDDLELFAALYRKPLDKIPPRHAAILELIEREGPLTIQHIKEVTGYLVKEITPVLHRLQEAFVIYEDQYDGEWDRGWHKFPDMFPDADLQRYTRNDALKIIIQRFAYRHVSFDIKMAKSFYKLPEKEIKTALASLIDENILAETEYGCILREDLDLLQNYTAEPAKFVYAMHRNDFLVKSNEHWLKEKYTHSYPDTLYYLFIDGGFKGAAVGKFRYTPEVEDISLDLPDNEATARKDEILQAVHALCGANNKIKRYQGEIL